MTPDDLLSKLGEDSALENFGVGLGRTRASIDDIAGNRSTARAYLASLGRGPA
jgi:hypothetical protein